jgi:HlyD family secretion protein
MAQEQVVSVIRGPLSEGGAVAESGVQRGPVNEQALQQTDDRLQIPELSRRARTRRVLGVLLLLAAAGGAAAYYTRPQPPVEIYRTDAATVRTIVHRVEATGSLDVRSRVEVPSPIPGRLTEVHVQARQQVEQGQLLATLDERAAELALESARATVQAAAGRVAQARAALEAARQGLERARSLSGKGLASAHAVSEAEADEKRAKVALDAARAEQKVASQTVASAKLGKSLGQIVAPRAGVLLRVPERLGAAVSPERGPLFVIGEPLTTMRIDAPVSETDIALIQPGQQAEVRVQALPSAVFTARVERIAIEPQRDGGVVLYPVTLMVDNPAGTLLPGMSARVSMEVGRAENVLSVHEAALRFSPDDAGPAEPRSRVFRHTGRPSELEAVSVTAGLSDGVYTEVRAKDGQTLSAGDALAIGLLRPDIDQKKPQVSLGNDAK